jgi:hypothetical protein
MTPQYYSASQIRALTNIPPRTFDYHLKANLAGIQDAREKVEGFGFVFLARKCQRYIALMAARPKARPGFKPKRKTARKP